MIFIIQRSVEASTDIPSHSGETEQQRNAKNFKGESGVGWG